MQRRLRMKPFKLPDNFLLGSATAATQIEGGDRNNNWYDWCARGKIKDGSTTFRADDHWNRYQEDIELLRVLNHKTYRMGIEWSRVEPEKGRVDSRAIARDRDEILRLRRSGILPLSTLHHFTHPLWFCKEGEFETRESVGYFVRYVRYVTERLGDLVTDYITINEPNVYVGNGYLTGCWPPGKVSPQLALKVFANIALCHIGAYEAIHEIRGNLGFPGKTMVGVANHLRIFTPHNRFNPLDRAAAGLEACLFQNCFVKLMSKGRLGFPASLFLPNKKGSYCDFIGINYYSRNNVHSGSLRDDLRSGAPVNDLGWEIYPEGLLLLCRRFYRRYKVPIWVTENGTCDNDDSFRARFIQDHLEAVARAIEEGIPVERYYHWSLLDNFEWLEGESARFGLIHVDYETQRRTIKRSGEFYGEICAKNGVTSDMIEKYDLSPYKKVC